MPTVPALPQFNVPGHDIFFPQITKDEEGFIIAGEIDGAVVIGGKTYGSVQPAVSITGLRQLARKHAAMVDQSELDEAQAEIEAVKAELASKEVELDNAQACIDAIDTFESAGFRARKKPGPRKPNKDTP